MAGALLLGTVLGGCSVRALAVKALADSLGRGGDVYASDPDPDLVREALPFALKTLETLLAEKPDHPGLLLQACSGFTQYGAGFVELDALLLEHEDFRRARRLRQRALGLSLRGRDYCLAALALDRPGVAEELKRRPEEAAASFGPEDITLLYWTAASWGSAISLGLDRPELTVDLPAVRALTERGLALESGFQQGAFHVLMIALESVSPAMGGSFEEARRHYERAVELSGGRLATPHVTFAWHVSVARQDQEEYRDLLQRALAVDPDAVPRERVANLLAQRRARYLLEHTEDYFL